MPQYLVTMDLVDVEPLLPIEALAKLKSEGKLLTGGYPVGQQTIVLIVEADSEEQLYETLEGLPVFESVRTSATELRSFEELRKFSERTER
jgi:hypothetical protein